MAERRRPATKTSTRQGNARRARPNPAPIPTGTDPRPLLDRGRTHDGRPLQVGDTLTLTTIADPARPHVTTTITGETATIWRTAHGVPLAKDTLTQPTPGNTAPGQAYQAAHPDSPTGKYLTAARTLADLTHERAARTHLLATFEADPWGTDPTVWQDEAGKTADWASRYQDAITTLNAAMAALLND